MLTTINFNAAERNSFETAGFTTMEILPLQFKMNVKSFKFYVENLNKTFAAAGNANIRVSSSPIKLKRIVGVVECYDQSLCAYHTIPDIDHITWALATE